METKYQLAENITLHTIHAEQFKTNVISVLYDKHKSISYITHGQVASRDITKANVIDFLIRLENFKVDRIHIEDKFGDDR